VIAFDLDVPEASRAVVPAVSASVSPIPAPAVEKAAPLFRRPIDLTVYSPDSRGVSAPVGVKPQLPRRLPAEVDPNGLGRIELVVSSDGTVESVKLLKAPRNVHDSMFLSAAKAWQFQPALKDGLPVRYRKTVWIAPQ
jgi:TonB family protein